MFSFLRELIVNLSVASVMIRSTSSASFCMAIFTACLNCSTPLIKVTIPANKMIPNIKSYFFIHNVNLFACEFNKKNGNSLGTKNFLFPLYMSNFVLKQ